MRTMTMKKVISNVRLYLVPIAAVALLLAATAHAAAPGVRGTSFGLTASAAFISQPDGQLVYSWGYACASGGSAVPFGPATGSACGGAMQIPGPTLIVTQGQSVSVTLTNNLPAAAGNT